MGLPDTQNDLEALVLCGRDDVLGGVALAAGVGADEGRQVLEAVEVGLIVAGRLARTIGVLVTEREAQSATGRNKGWGSR